MKLFALVNFLLAAVAGTAAIAQETTAQTPPEATSGEITMLMFFTLGVVLLLAIVAFMAFLRKRSNREAADRALNPNHPSNK